MSTSTSVVKGTVNSSADFWSFFLSITLSCVGVCVPPLSRVQLCVSPQTLVPSGLLCLWGFPGKSTSMDCHFLIQEIFPTQGLNSSLHLLSPSLAGGFFTAEPPGNPSLLYASPPILAASAFLRSDFWLHNWMTALCSEFTFHLSPCGKNNQAES